MLNAFGDGVVAMVVAALIQSGSGKTLSGAPKRHNLTQPHRHQIDTRVILTAHPSP